MTALTERYIAATATCLPPALQEDVRTELTALIMDAIDARIDQGEEPDAAERAVLTELGDPAVFAARYAERPLHLIGPRHYLAWRRLLRVLLWIVPACAVAGMAIAQTLVQAPLGTVIGESVAVGLGAVVHVSFWVTLGSHPRTHARDRRRMDAEQPEPSLTRRTDAVASVVLVGIGAAAVLWDQLRGIVRVDGETASLLNPGLWPTWILVLLALMALEAALAVAVVLRRRWTPSLATVNTVLAVLFVSTALTLLGRGQLLNPSVVEFALRSDGLDQSTLQVIGVIFVLAVIGGAAWDIVDGWRKTARDGRA